MIDLRTERDQRRAVLEPWKCDGTMRNGRPCLKLLMKLDWARPSAIEVICERCGHRNLFVESYRPT